MRLILSLILTALYGALLPNALKVNAVKKQKAEMSLKIIDIEELCYAPSSISITNDPCTKIIIIIVDFVQLESEKMIMKCSLIY